MQRDPIHGRIPPAGAEDLSGAKNFQAFFARDPVTVARELIGTTLLVDGVGGRIVETEAYAPDDPASHSYKGKRPGNASMFSDPGTAYVYRSYGIHWCLNFVCTTASAVLIRALEPATGIDQMIERRGGIADLRLLCSGPGRLCQALGVNKDLDGRLFDRAPFNLDVRASEPVTLLAGPRIGLTRAMDTPWRFGMAGSRFLSKPFR